ncbi:MAG: PTS sugar transporter subunit IIB [Erysipelotrichaceae bacterium]
MSICFVRIDDRLIHGQIVTAWLKNYQAKNILIVDELVSKDEFLKNVLQMVKPSGVDLIIKGTELIEETISFYEKDAKSTLLLVKNPETAKLIFDCKIALNKLNVGGMGANKNRKALYKNVSASDDEIVTLNAIQSSGISVYFQATPNDKQVELSSINIK